MRTILDTGPLVALLNRRDQYHAWAAETFRDIKPPLWTCEAVLTEAAHLTGAPAQVMEMIKDGLLRVGLELEDQADALAVLLRRYRPGMDLADACIVRMSEITRSCRVLTLDRNDFSVYRRNGRDVIPLLAPEG